MDELRYINFGAGNPAENWYNLDASPFFLIPRFFHRLLLSIGISTRSADFVNRKYKYFKYSPDKRFPLEDGTCKAIYCSCVLEHLPYSYIDPILKEFFRILGPGGVVRIIVPDIEKDIQEVCATNKGWINLNDTLGIIPDVMLSNPIRSALEAFVGFPSVHKTFLLKKNLRRVLGKHWIVYFSKKPFDSKINHKILSKVESKSKYKTAIVVDLIKKHE